MISACDIDTEMEFFEKAHVSKKQQSKKDTKSDEIVKKQLKQMLQGYKRSDNALIKSSGNADSDLVEAHRCIDDSASVSGFSDLDLTNSGSEEDISQPTTSKATGNILSNSSKVNLSNLTDLNTDDVDQESMDEIDGIHSEDSNVHESQDKEDSFSEDIELSDDSHTSRDVSLIDFEGTMTEYGSDDTDSDIFDPDGALATKILEKLGKNQSKSSQKGKKRKLKVSNESKSKKIHVKSDTDSKENGINDNVLNMEALNIDNDDDEIIESVMDSNSAHDSVSTNDSSPFISITVTDMPDHKLSDIIGDYHHPTIRNIQSVVHSTNFSGLFSMGTTDDDTASLLPEIGDAEIIEELIDDLEEPKVCDESTQTLEEIGEIPVVSTVSTEIQSDEETFSEEEYINPVRVYQGKKSCIFILKHPIELYVNGKVKIKPLVGTVEVFGHILKDAVDLYAPNNNIAQCLKTVENRNDYYGLFRKLINEGLTVSEAEDIVVTVGTNDCVITMSRLSDPKMDFVETYANTDLFKKLNKNTESTLRRTASLLGCSLYLARPWRYFEEPDLWDSAINFGFGESIYTNTIYHRF